MGHSLLGTEGHEASLDFTQHGTDIDIQYDIQYEA